MRPELFIDTVHKRVEFYSVDMDLTPREIQVLLLLVSNKGLSPREIAARTKSLGSDMEMDANNVRNVISGLRDKFEKIGDDIIITYGKARNSKTRFNL
jgi:DNA-binding response OmpR family regulator